jgi:hypothetical protein
MNILNLYLEYLSKEQVSSAAGICGIDSISSGKPLKMPIKKKNDEDKEDEEQNEDED